VAIAVFFIFFWYFFTHEYYSPHFGKKEKNYTIKTRYISTSEMIRTHYYKHGGKAQDMRYKNGLRHQNSESYYETGEQFRSALYYFDTLVTEVFFNKNRDTIYIRNVSPGNPSTLELEDRKNNVIIKVEYENGLILPGTLREMPMD
jgi:hypothetical protein